MHDAETEVHAHEFKTALKVLGVPITRHDVGSGSTMGGMMAAINRLVQETEMMAFDELIVNVGAASTMFA